MKNFQESDVLVAAVFKALEKFDCPRHEKFSAIYRADQLRKAYSEVHGEADGDFLFGGLPERKEERNV